MFSNILSSLKDNLSGDLVEKAGVSKEQLPQIFDQIGNVAKEKLGAEVASGNMSSLMNLFSKKDNTAGAGGIQASLTSGIVSALAGKFGVDEAKATMISNMVVPKLIDLISNKNSSTSDTDSSILSDLLGGDKSGGMMDKAKDALGGLF